MSQVTEYEHGATQKFDSGEPYVVAGALRPGDGYVTGFEHYVCMVISTKHRFDQVDLVLLSPNGVFTRTLASNVAWVRRSKYVQCKVVSE